MKKGFVYILGSKSLALYIGVTADLVHRIYEHKYKANGGHTGKYNINKLLYFEEHDSIYEAIEREKQLKRWSRQKKWFLIDQENSKCEDLAVDWYKDGYQYIDE